MCGRRLRDHVDHHPFRKSPALCRRRKGSVVIAAAPPSDRDRFGRPWSLRSTAPRPEERHEYGARDGNPAGYGTVVPDASACDYGQAPPVGADVVSDHVLLGGFAIGNADTGTAFVRRFQGRVYGMAVNMLGDRGLAEEVAQEAFVRAWRYADAYDPERASVATWLLRITRNLAIDALRRRRPAALGPERVAALTPPGPVTAVEDATVASELSAQAQAALSRLPPGQAKAVRLAAFYGHSAQQVAVSEGIPLGTAKSRIGRGLRPCEPSSPMPTRCNDDFQALGPFSCINMEDLSLPAEEAHFASPAVRTTIGSRRARGRERRPLHTVVIGRTGFDASA